MQQPVIAVALKKIQHSRGWLSTTVAAPGPLIVLILVAAAISGCSGSTRPIYTAASNPCVNSRLKHGDWRDIGMPRQEAVGLAEMWCSYGHGFDSVSDPAEGIGPNTSGWDDPALMFKYSRNAASPSVTAPQAPTAAPPTVYPSQSPQASGCQTSSHLLAAWNADPSARLSWTTLHVSGFQDITCWREWIVASPITNANGLVVFYTQHGQVHLLPETDLPKLDTAVCSSPDAPSDWTGPAGPATCTS